MHIVSDWYLHQNLTFTLPNFKSWLTVEQLEDLPWKADNYLRLKIQEVKNFPILSELSDPYLDSESVEMDIEKSYSEFEPLHELNAQHCLYSN